MVKSLVRDRSLVALVVLVLLLKLFSLNSQWVEDFYSRGIYLFISRLLRLLFGWLPFSLGDVFYSAAFVWLGYKLWRLMGLIRSRRLKGKFSGLWFRKYLKLLLIIYTAFTVNWGLNYYRQGIQQQLGLKLEPYTTNDLYALTTALQNRVNTYAAQIDSLQRLRYNNNSFLFEKGINSYHQVSKSYPFLAYKSASIKPSLFTAIGHWFGFTGYYNPLSAEAQLKTSIPVFLKPFVVTHEMAHQLGYAKENEASFVAYLTCKSGTDLYFLYSAYFEMYRDGLYTFASGGDKAATAAFVQNQHQRVTLDILELKLYNARNKNFIEPVMSSAYDKYLKLNNQPKGKATYNEVIAYLVAYLKKYGKEAI